MSAPTFPAVQVDFTGDESGPVMIWAVRNAMRQASVDQASIGEFMAMAGAIQGNDAAVLAVCQATVTVSG